MDCDHWIWNAACKLLPACRFDYEKERLKNIIQLYQDGLYSEAENYIVTKIAHKGG